MSIKSSKPSKRDRLVHQLWEEQAGVRLGKFKLVYYKGGRCYGWLNPPPGVITDLPEELPDCTGYMLFDLDADPNEATDLSKDPRFAEDLKEVKRFYKSELKRRVPPQIPILNPNMPAFSADWEPGWCASG
ncbi:arylsulfatase B-like [Pomacea canaliculata]|uniref:arylsulfatase B-like n=1 Tax=Pomacea canaliculata TaxID=400727 RepID=UPI000D736C36|nr:arylsulfatase B-like [Pomacea canaliculata]